MRILLTLGRLPKALELARCLKAAGCEVFVAEPFGTHICKASNAVTKCFRVTAPNTDAEAYLSELLKIIADTAIDMVIPVSEEVVHVSRLRDRLPPQVRMFAPDHATILGLHDKFNFIEIVRRAELRAPATFWASSDAAKAFSSAHDYVLKPALGCSGKGLQLRRKGEPIGRLDDAGGIVLQQRIDGQEISSMSVCENGRVLGTALYRGLVFSGTVSTCFERIEHARATEWIERFVAHTAYSGFIAFDMIVDTSGDAWPIECNPRLTSGLHFMDHADLAARLLGQPTDGLIRMKPQASFQEGHTTLLEAYGVILRPREFARRIGYMARAKDVLWSVRDPLPFLLMTPLSWPVLRQVLFDQKGFGEAATRDIEWRNSPLAQGLDSPALQPP